jgi:hypothetical protein
MQQASPLLIEIKRQLLKSPLETRRIGYGHVQRMEEGRLLKEVMECNPPGRRKRGRPKATWAEGIRGLIGERGLLEEDWNDRDSWRKKII